MRRIVLLAAACGIAMVSLRAQPLAPSRPNIILIITDDVGYGDIGSYGAPDIKTPNIDGLAKSGTRLTQFYANASSCTPTRAGLISGRYQQRFALERPLSAATSPDKALGLPATGRSLPQLLRNSGYATALIGKWHLGYLPQFSPKAHGFDSFFGFKSGYIDYYQHTDGLGEPDLFEERATRDGDGLHDRSDHRAIGEVHRPITRSRRSSSRSPTTPPHWPYQVPDQPSKAIGNARHVLPHDENPSTRADYVKIMERADQGVGRILAALERQGLAANTLVIFTNDNGGEWLSRNAPLFNRKFTSV